jgi:Tfp pilus assembly protein PilV
MPPLSFLVRDKLREGVAMVELIFAIVVMGIALISSPNLITTATKSSFVAMQQEAINAAASELNMVLSYAWDEADTDDSHIPPILTVSNGDSDLDMTGGKKRRSGTPEGSSRLFITDNNQIYSASATLGKDSGESDIGSYDDIDDFNDQVTKLTTQSAQVDVVDRNISMKISVSYNSDSLDSGGYNQNSISFTPFVDKSPTSNIKSVTVTLTSDSGVDELEKNITMRAFSCNIGGYKLVTKEF